MNIHGISLTSKNIMPKDIVSEGRGWTSTESVTPERGAPPSSSAFRALIIHMQ